MYEEEKSLWAKEMADLLLKGKGMADKARAAGKEAVFPEDMVLIEQEPIDHLVVFAQQTRRGDQ